MKTEIVTIDPELAKYYLQFNKSNRPFRVHNMQYFAKLIEQGEFTLTHQGVAFTGSVKNPGKLIDGQHRLSAIVETGTPVKVQVSWNCPEQMFHNVDCGASRTFRDLHGWDTRVTSIVQAIGDIAIPQNIRMSKTDADKIMNVFGDEINLLLHYAGAARKGLTTAGIRAAVVILMKQKPDDAELILEAYKSLSNCRLDLVPPIVQRLYTRLLEIDGGSRSVREKRFLLAMKAMDPDNWKTMRLVSCPGDKQMAMIREFVRNKLNI